MACHKGIFRHRSLHASHTDPPFRSTNGDYIGTSSISKKINGMIFLTVPEQWQYCLPVYLE